MIALYTTIQAEVEIQAAQGVVWQTFRHIEAWSQWYPGVLAATWEQGEAWTPQALMRLQVQNSLRLTMTTVAAVHAADNDTLIWENRGAGLRTVCRARICAIDGGAKLTLHKAYSGAAVGLLQVLKRRQEAMLRQGLDNLRQRIESTEYSHDPTCT